VPERVGNALLSIRSAKNPSLMEDLFKPLLKASDGLTIRMTEDGFVEGL
jgi:hypothetical protein